MTNFELIKERAGGSPEGAAAFMLEIFILGFNLAVECMETGSMAPDADVLEQYFVWFLGREAEGKEELSEDPEAGKEAARAQMAAVRDAMSSGEKEERERYGAE